MAVAQAPAVPATPRAITRILARLQDVVPVRDARGVSAYRCACPTGHAVDVEDDKLVVTEGADGRVILTCEAGCKARTICDALGLQLRDLFPRPGEEVTSAVDPSALPPAVRALDAPPIEPVEWAIEDLWTKGEIGLLVGDGGSFKSTAALHMAAAMAGGYRVFNRYACARKPVLVVSAEDSQSIVLMRLEAFIEGHAWDRTRVLENVHLVTTPDVSLSDPRWQAHLAAEAHRLGVGMVILDPLADLLAGDENSNSDVRPVLKWARQLGAGTGAAIAIVHHAGKASADKRQLDRIRGASAIASASRTIFFFEWQATGVLVQHLKMSRAPKLEPFVLTRHIDSDPDNRAQWYAATLTYEEARTAAMNRAEAFILAQVSASPRRLTTSDLKKMVQGTGISGEDIARGLTALQAMNRLDYESGSRGAKRWFVLTRPNDVEQPSSTLPDGYRQGGESDVADVAGPCPATSSHPADDLAPRRGQGKVVGDSNDPGKLEDETPELDPDVDAVDDEPWNFDR